MANDAVFHGLCAYALRPVSHMDGYLFVLWRSMGSVVDQVLGVAVEVSSGVGV